MRDCVYSAVSSKCPEMRWFRHSFRENRPYSRQWLSDGGENSAALPLGCRGSFACLAEYLEWDAASAAYTAFKPSAPTDRVYFIGIENGPVKIGVTNNPNQRLEHLQTSSPVPLKLLAVVLAGRSLERAYHSYFGPHRIRGEWFARCPDLESEIRYWSAKARRHG